MAAVLMARAIGDRFHAVMVDNGLLRKGERADVVRRLNEECGVNLRAVDASALFLGRLEGVEDPERKRKIIGHTFIEVFEAEARAIGETHFLLQGTLYPDVIESVSFKGPSATIKSHHNVGGLLADMKLALIEPLRELFKDEVRALGRTLGLPEDVVNRHPFPGPGLAIRILGPITAADCDLLREADDIFLQELRAAGEYARTGQAFAVLLPCRSVGVMGDARTYEKTLALRAVTTSDYMTADWARLPFDLLARVSSRVINEVRGINRVVYDITSKPPGTIEWLVRGAALLLTKLLYERAHFHERREDDFDYQSVPPPPTSTHAHAVVVVVRHSGHCYQDSRLCPSWNTGQSKSVGLQLPRSGNC